MTKTATFDSATAAVAWLYDNCGSWAGLDLAAQEALYDAIEANGKASLFAASGEVLTVVVA